MAQPRLSDLDLMTQVDVPTENLVVLEDFLFVVNVDFDLVYVWLALRG